MVLPFEVGEEAPPAMVPETSSDAVGIEIRVTDEWLIGSPVNNSSEYDSKPKTVIPA
jgi:hypothetical protein